MTQITYLTLKQLSKKVGNRSRSSLYRDFDAGRLPKPVKIGGRLYVEEGAVEEAIEAHDEAEPEAA